MDHKQERREVHMGNFRPVQPITRDKYLTARELSDLYALMWAQRNDPAWSDKFDMVRMVLGAGLRVSEIPTLRKPEDCHEDGIIHVRKSKTGLQRLVRVSPEYLPWYQAKWQSLSDGPWFPRSAVNGRGYTTPYTTRTMQMWWAEVLSRANVRPLSIHAGRHTYATWELATRRLLIHEVQAQLGHRSEHMTLAFYSHAVVECLYNRSEPEWRKVATNGTELKSLSLAV